MCSICACVNPYSAGNCKVCNGYRSSGTPVAPAPPTPPTIPVANPNEWACNVCTLQNPLTAAVCNACESGQRPIHLSPSTVQPVAQPPAARVTAVPPNTYPYQQMQAAVRPPQQQQAVFQQQQMLLQQQQQRGPVSWPCSTCTYENAIAAPKCQMCESLRPPQFAAFAPTPSGQHVVPQSTLPAARLTTPPPAPGSAAVAAAANARDIAWQQDNVVLTCNKCNTAFTLLNRKHHCRACGFVFCHNCSSNRIPLKPGGIAERVCIDCFREKL